MKVDDSGTGGGLIGPRMSVNLSVERQTPDTGFGKRVQNGLNAASNAVGAGLGAVASLTPGGYAVSAAVSSLGTTPNGTTSGPSGNVVAVVSPAAPMSTTVTPAAVGAPVGAGNVTLAASQAGAEQQARQRTAERAPSLLETSPRAEALMAGTMLAQTNAAAPIAVSATPGGVATPTGTPTAVTTVGTNFDGLGAGYPSAMNVPFVPGGGGGAVPGVGGNLAGGTAQFSSLLNESARVQMQALMFQQQMSQETIVFSTMSNVIKARHEASYNSIKNIT